MAERAYRAACACDVATKVKPAMIDWSFPTPRRGFDGALDRFVGPGATSAELALQLVAVCIAAPAAVWLAISSGVSWTWLQYVVCALLATDIAGGIATTSTSTAKRWYHREGQGARQHLAFVAIHVVHIAAVGWLFLGLDLTWIASATLCLLVAAAAIVLAPVYLQRPTAMLCYAAALMVCLFGLAPPQGLEWFLPLLYFKLLVGHLPREEPYRP